MIDPPEQKSQTPTAAIALIGNELLSGKVRDENGLLMIAALRAQGVELREVRIIPDDVRRIAETVREFAGQYTHVFTTGGVGPTHDDITLEGVADAFGVRLVEDGGMMHQIDQVFADQPEKRAAFSKMARIPEGTTLIRTGEIRWPIYQVQNVFILPGVPEIFRKQFDAIRDRFRGEPFFLRTIYFRVGEGTLASKVTEACERYPGVALGSYPVWNNEDYRVRVTIESKERQVVEDTYGWLIDQFEGDDIFKVVDGGN